MGLRREASTVRVYSEFASRFAEFTRKQDNFTEDDALRFIDHLIGEGFSDSYVRWTFYALRLPCRRLSFHRYPRRPAPGPPQGY